MFMQKADRKDIYTVLFRWGFMFAGRAPQERHPEEELSHLTNLQVIQTMRSLKSQGYVSEQMAWSHCYWCLSNEGIEYLRDYLHMPPDMLPGTLQRSNEPVGMSRASRNPSSWGQRDCKEDDDRTAYRRTERLDNSDKTGNVGAGSAAVEFRGGFGRGRK